MNKNYGLKQVVEKEGDYHFGAYTKLSGLPLTDGQWDKFLPSPDDQSKGNLETYACTCYGTCNVLEILSRQQGFNLDFSQRYLAINGGLTVDSQGGDPNTVAEAARHLGLIDEPLLPFDDSVTTLQQFYSPTPMTSVLLSKGKEFTTKYKIEHDTVTPLPAFLMEALKYSPLGVSVLAWVPKEGTDMYYFPQGQGYNHWCCLYGFVEGQYWLVWDSYEGNSKKVTWDSVFGYTKRYSLTLQPMTPQDKNIFMQILTKLAQVLGLIKQEIPVSPIQTTVIPNAVTTPIPLQPAPLPIPPVIPENIQGIALKACKDVGLSSDMTDRLFATVHGESGWNNEAIHVNKNADGSVSSTDWYLCQVNDFFHIGTGKDFPSKEYVHDNPDKVLHWMALLFKEGKGNLWDAYKRLYPNG